jgi:glycine/D-amino acid oxidase-like deaminating enzyme
MVRLEARTRERIRSLCAEKSIECDLDRDIHSFKLYDDVSKYEKDLGFWGQCLSVPLGLLGLQGMGREELNQRLNLLPSSPISHAIRLPASADTFWPAKFVTGLLREAKVVGGERLAVATNTRVVGIVNVSEGSEGGSSSGGGGSDPNRRIRVETDRGCVECGAVVVATNAWSSQLLPELKGKIMPIRNHVLCTAPLPPLCTEGNGRGGFGLSPGFVYWMQREDGRLIVGGFRDIEKQWKGVGISDDGTVDTDVHTTAAAFIPTHFDLKGAKLSVEHSWTGIIGWSCDNMPWVGQMPGREGVFVCAGFSGHGMTQALSCGEAVAAMAMGEEPPPGTHVDRFMPVLTRSGEPWGAGNPHGEE